MQHLDYNDYWVEQYLAGKEIMSMDEWLKTK